MPRHDPTVYVVAIIEHETERTEKTFDACASRRDAERLERGVNINLDHARYYTEIRETKHAAFS